MTTQEKLLLIEKARAEFERAVKTALGTDSACVEVKVFSKAGLFSYAPAEWRRTESGNLIWASSNPMGTNVFGIIEAQS